MSLQIIPSQQLLIISSQTKLHYLFDPKTTSVLSKFSHDHAMQTKPLYFQPSKQIIMAHHNRSFITIWDIQTQQSITTISLSQNISTFYLNQPSGLLLGGSVNGIIYIWELPSGILIKKFSAHNHSIKAISVLAKNGHIITVSKTQAKIWTYLSLFVENQDSPISQLTLHLPSQVIAAQIERGLLFTLHKATLCISNLQSLTIKQIIQLQSHSKPTCFCLSRSEIYVGNNTGLIHQYSLSDDLFFDSKKGPTKSKMLQYVNGRLEINEDDKKRKKQKTLQLKNPISCLAFVNSLGVLISGTTQGQVGIWQHGKLKKSVQLYTKQPIQQIAIIKRPENQNKKIQMCQKIKSLHKYEMTKQKQALFIYQQYDQNEFQINSIKNQLKNIGQQFNNENNQILQRMMSQIGQPYEIMKQQIEILEKQKDMLIKDNQQYAKIILQMDKIIE